MKFRLTFGFYTGTCQERFSRCERHDTDHERAVGDGDMAGDLVFGVPGVEACEEGRGYDSGREDVTWYI